MRNTLFIALLALLPALANAAVITYARTDFPSGRPPERIMAPSSSDADLYEEVKQTGNALHTYDAYAGAGERIEDSTTGTDYQSTSEECGMSAEVDLSGNTSTTVYNGPAILCGYRMVVTVGTAAATIDDNTTAKMTIPVAWPVGEYHVEGAIFETSLVINPADTSTGTLQLRYRPLDADTTWVP